jgi:hypothetical protein
MFSARHDGAVVVGGFVVGGGSLVDGCAGSELMVAGSVVSRPSNCWSRSMVAKPTATTGSVRSSV